MPALVSCSVGSTRGEIVGNQEINGKIIEATSSTPISAALVIFTLPEGNSWNLPTSFLLGYTFTESDGSFHLPASPKPVKDLRRARASITIDVYHPDYKQSVTFKPRSQAAGKVLIKMKKKDPLEKSVNVCTYNNPEICKIVDDYFGR
jgi:hypothetical protein